jgi:predicted Fe-S protein YdhL (DUF1289 family)
MTEEGFLKSPCLCEIDQDGRCAACSRKMSEFVNGLAQITFEQQRAISRLIEKTKTNCDSCDRRGADYTIAKIIRDDLSKLAIGIGREYIVCVSGAVQSLKSMFQNRVGLLKWPLSDLEMDKLKKKHV